MLGFFTDPYPDELLYSVFSRYHSRVGNSSKEATAHDLFGNARACVVVDLPSRLQHLIARLPPGHRYSVERLIDEHTVLPFYEPFMPSDRALQLRRQMSEEDKGGAIHGRIGVLTSQIRLDRLRYCPACVREDKEQCGETYWHRTHQLPGIEVCASHAVFLERSSVSVLNRSNDEAFVTAKQALKDVATTDDRSMDEANPAHRAVLRIAEDATWLLGNHVGPTGLDRLRDRYFDLLRAQDLVKTTNVKLRRMQARFEEHYSSELLRDLRCPLERRYNWLRRIVQASHAAHPPLHHLLLMRFLNCSAEMFFRFPVEGAKQLGETAYSRNSTVELKPSISNRGEHHNISDSEWEVKRTLYRGRWVRAVAEHPGLGRSAVKSKSFTAYNWLVVNDKEWFERNAPPRQKPPGPPILVDWSNRDTEFVAEVEAAYKQLVSAPGRPVRASRRALARAIKQLGAVYKSADKLPLTNRTLDELGESAEAYAVRRIEWATECFRQENTKANRWHLLTRAAVSAQMAVQPSVVAALELAVFTLNPINEQASPELCSTYA